MITFYSLLFSLILYSIFVLIFRSIISYLDIHSTLWSKFQDIAHPLIVRFTSCKYCLSFWSSTFIILSLGFYQGLCFQAFFSVFCLFFYTYVKTH